MKFTVGVLLYGGYPDLARRVLTPLLPHWEEGRIALRVGANAACEETVEFLRVAGLLDYHTWVDTTNPGKYPMMRRMLYAGGVRPIDTPYSMWFDDDSYIREEATARFFDRAEAVMDQGYDLVSNKWQIRLAPGQAEWIMAQPWYDGKTKFCTHQVVHFFGGGWWMARTQSLFASNYPFPELYHNGGDVMMGVLAGMKGWKTTGWNDGVEINKEPRRGLSTPPIGTKPK